MLVALKMFFGSKICRKLVVFKPLGMVMLDEIASSLCSLFFWHFVRCEMMAFLSPREEVS